MDLAARRNRKKTVTCVDKSNMIAAHTFFREQVTALARTEFPDIRLEFAYVDAFCLSQLQDPGRYDVVLCPNFVGDIVSDAAALLMGGLGMAPSANLGEAHAMFEPVHGSAPDIAGKGLANPMGMLLSTGMMFDWLSVTHGPSWMAPLSSLLARAVADCCRKGIVTPDISGSARSHSCRAVGAAVCRRYKDALTREAVHGKIG